MTRFIEGGWRVATVDATAIAVAHKLGSRTNPIVNTAILGAFSSVTGLVGIDSVTEAIGEGIPTKPESNIAAAIEASHEIRTSLYEEVKL